MHIFLEWALAQILGGLKEVYKLKKSIENRRRADFVYKKNKKEYNKSGGDKQ